MLEALDTYDFSTNRCIKDIIASILVIGDRDFCQVWGLADCSRGKFL